VRDTIWRSKQNKEEAKKFEKLFLKFQLLKKDFKNSKENMIIISCYFYYLNIVKVFLDFTSSAATAAATTTTPRTPSEIFLT